MKNATLVIMAGGSGTRFWPKSTSRRPKQLLAFGADSRETLLAQTLARFDGLVAGSCRMIVTTSQLTDAIRGEKLEAEVLAEPAGRNTAACVYWAARVVAQRDPKAVMLVMPSDHSIRDLSSFSKTVGAAIDRAATHDELVTLGVKPTRPETGYGYLKTGSAIEGPCRKVDRFVEKPNLENARKFVADANYLWNGGMFIWRAEVVLAAFDKQMPEMKKAWDAAGGDVQKAYPNLTATSIDFGVMEKADNVVTFPLDCGWDDLGSWTSLEDMAEQLRARHPAGVVTAGEVIAVESTGNIVDAPGKLVALLGVEDLIVVEHGERLLVARKDRAQDIKLVVEQVKLKRPDLA